MASDQVHKNHEAYENQFKEKLEREHWGKIALMHNQEIIYILNDIDDAYTVGERQYGLGNFSLVEIGKKPIRLGWRATQMALS
ncbi:MAG: hypothetical protein OXE04_07595 [bacterium]|nr:hypothetical protein [bacterium]MCY4258128.1 hypothetical protein [bacterium]